MVQAQQNGNGLDIQLNKNVTTQRLSQSEDKQPEAIENYLSQGWITKSLQVAGVSASIGYLALQTSWLAMFIEPAIHLLVRWTVFGIPILLGIYYAMNIGLFYQGRHKKRPDYRLIAAAIGLWLAWYLHGIDLI